MCMEQEESIDIWYEERHPCSRFLLSIIDRYKGNILVVCPNSFFTISGYTGVVKRRGDDYGVLL